VKQSVFTVVAEVEPAGLDDLRRVLGDIGADPGGNPRLPLARFAGLHFASIVLADGARLRSPQLILEANVDGTAEAWLAALVAAAPAGLDALYASSPGYPGGGEPGVVWSWLVERIVRPRAYHIGATGRSVDRITAERRLHEAIASLLDDQDRGGDLKEAPPETVRDRIEQYVAAHPDLAWALHPAPPRQTRRERLACRARAAAVVTGAVLLAPVLVPMLLVAAAVLVVKEQLDPVQTGPPDPEAVRAIECNEDLPGHVGNHLASVIPVKPGRLRAALLPAVLFGVNLVARVTATKGKLGGIPSIHFAHWTLIDDGRHLVFLSNFDGSWESYLGDFIDKAALGLTAVWSNTVDFPRTRLLAFAGARDGPRFRQWARAHQCRTDVWYSAYPDLTMPAIDNNSAIRDGLATGGLDPEETQRWLRRL
jgi:hypothetical protein